MKKLISLFLALAMLMGSVAFAEAADYIGVWTLTCMDDGTPFNPLDLGLEITMELQEGGVCIWNTVGSINKGTWVATDTGIEAVEVTDGKKHTYVFVLTDGKLIQETNGRKNIYECGAMKSTLVGPATLKNVPAEAFEGQWKMTKVVVSGFTMTAKEIGLDQGFDLAGGRATISETDDLGNQMQMSMVYSITEDNEKGTTLTMLDPSAGGLMSLNMLEDGSLYREVEADGAVIGYYFERLVEE